MGLYFGFGFVNNIYTVKCLFDFFSFIGRKDKANSVSKKKE